MICTHYNIFAQSTFNTPIKTHRVAIQQVHLKDSLAGSTKKIRRAQHSSDHDGKCEKATNLEEN